MKRILLLSSSRFLINHPQIFDKPFKDLKMAYVITASKGSTSLDYLQRERDFFKQQNYNYTELDIDGKNEVALKDILNEYEIVYVTGGNSFYLLKSIKETGFDKVMKELIPKSLKVEFFKAILDSYASEHGARMTAMHKATDNATEMIKQLTLNYNKARQAAITGEILEIVGGAEALKG